MDFSKRAELSELMDTETCTFEDFRGCLEDLAAVNRLTLAYRPTLQWFATLLREGRLPAGRPVRIIDVGSGYGDMLRHVAAWGRRRGIEMTLTGVDMNPWSARAAAEACATASISAVGWVTANAFDFMPDSGANRR